MAYGGGGVGTLSARAARRCVVHGSAARDGSGRERGEGPCKIARYCQTHSGRRKSVLKRILSESDLLGEERTFKMVWRRPLCCRILLVTVAAAMATGVTGAVKADEQASPGVLDELKAEGSGLGKVRGSLSATSLCYIKNTLPGRSHSNQPWNSQSHLLILSYHPSSRCRRWWATWRSTWRGEA